MNERETLYGQLPAIHRRRDAEQGEPLRALLAIIDAQLQAVQADVETTWDNWFVETAEEWLVPYLGQALGVTVARDIGAIAFSRRAFVANTLRYRRGKGTPAMVELLARDLTNYPTRVVEFFTRMAWNEALNHQTGRAATLDIRATAALERLSGPFGEVGRTGEGRRIAAGGTARRFRRGTAVRSHGVSPPLAVLAMGCSSPARRAAGAPRQRLVPSVG